MSAQRVDIPNRVIKEIVEKGGVPSVHITNVESHRISCPLCRAGYALISVESLKIGEKTEVKINGMDEPHKCVLCEGKFKLAMKVVGVPFQPGEMQ